MTTKKSIKTKKAKLTQHAPKILNGTKVANRILEKVAEEVKELKHQPVLTVMYQGSDPANMKYMKNQVEVAAKCGIKVKLHKMPNNTRVKGAHTSIFSHQATSDGIIIQRPLSPVLEENYTDIVNKAIVAEKDVEGVTDANLGHIMQNLQNDVSYTPCTPNAIIALLKEYGIDVAGKRVAIISRSVTVGKPLAMMLTNMDATVTICHSKTKYLSMSLADQEIIISATGKKALINKNTLRYNNKMPVIVDVGMTEVKGKFYGDCAATVYNSISAYSPVIGGVGCITTAMLLQNVVKAAKHQDYFINE